MKNYLIPFLVIGLLVSASFGLVMMNHMDGQGHSNCPFDTAGASGCAQARNPIDFVVSHLNALSRFFSALPVNSLASLISLFLLSILAIATIFNKESEFLKLRPLFAKNHFHESFVPINKVLITRWFSLHENSPAFIGGR